MLVVCILLIYLIYNILNIKKNEKNEYNINSSIGFKAIAVVLIFFAHILQKRVALTPSIFEIIVRNCAFIGVSIFFFNSGYGYAKKYNEKNMNLAFLHSHIFKILFPYLIILIFYNIVSLKSNHLVLFLPYSWYVFAIISATILYYICNKIKVVDKNVSLFIFTFVTTLILYFLEIDYYVLSQLFTFSFGCLLASKSIGMKTKKINYFIIFFLFSLFYILYLGFNKFNLEEFKILQIIIGNIASCLIAFLTYLLGKTIILTNKINIYLNRISYWFYLCQSISVFLFLDYSVLNDNFMIILSILINCILSSILYRTFGKIRYKSIIKKEVI